MTPKEECEQMDTDSTNLWPDVIQAHYQRAWSTIDMVHCLLDKEDIRPGMEGFSVLEIPPHGSMLLWTYATCGMSKPEDKAPLELHLYSRTQDEGHIELLTAIANYHITGAPLGLWHTVNFGRPWMPGSQCDYGFISLPYLDGPRLEVRELGPVTVRFLWLIPMTFAEREYKREHGAEALEALFDQGGFDYSDPARPSLV